MIAAARIELIARRALDDRQAALIALSWYAESKAFAADLGRRFDLTLGDVVGILAALSPQNGWQEQVIWTPRILESLGAFNSYSTPDSSQEAGVRFDTQAAELAGHIPGPGFTANKRKAARIWLGEDPLEVLSGPKVRAFYACIMTAGYTDQVCIDRHAWSIAQGLQDGLGSTLTPKRYRRTVAAYCAAAAALRASYPVLAARLTAPNVQALTWVYWKDNPDMIF